MTTESPFVETREIEMPTGVLSVSVEQSEVCLDQLCTYAARVNPKRGFLFASHYLARELPVKPSQIAALHEMLALKLQDDMPGPVVFIGMAEYAVSLGQGIFESYLERTGRQDLLYLHTTRFSLERQAFISFKEEHSHAPSHIVYYPDDAFDRQLLQQAKTLVLIDDEASTGKTFLNLAKAFALINSHIEKIVTVVITDWRGDDQTSAIEAAMPAPCGNVSLLKGSYSFVPQPGLKVDMPNVCGCTTAKDHLLQDNFGRFGTRAALTLSHELMGSLNFRSTDKVLVLGTGEFVHLPYLLAHALELRGIDVRSQSTTRNPLMTWGPIEHSLTFENKVHGIPSFLYNCQPELYDRVLLCVETPAELVDQALIDTLQCEVISFFK